ncbi:Fc.00g076390.m01.CDS01 [Cosmosporella sp. VM-42]
MSIESKTETPTTEVPASNFDDDSHDFQLESKERMFRIVDNARVALTALALAAGLTILGVSADAIAVYNATHVSGDFLLPLWPDNFDLRPTVALVTGSAIVLVANVVSLLASKTQSIRDRATIHTSVTFAAPAVAFIASTIAMAFFYAVNASATTDSFQSWTCRWRDVSMMVQPHFGTLCKQSEAGVALAVLLVPLESIILGVAAYQAVLERQLDRATRGSERKAGSPALS